MIEKFFEEELHYLFESGKEFAKAHPDRAQFLNIDSIGDRDPYVERLFEGFAFLTGRIREKLEDSFPQLIEGIINLLWPQLLHEIASMAVVQFSPRVGAIQQKKILPRGSEVLSQPCGPESTVCRFITTQQIDFFPFALQKVEKITNNKGLDVVTFSFALPQAMKGSSLELRTIPLYLHAEFPTAMMLHEYCNSQIANCRISINKKQVHELHPSFFYNPSGITQETSLLPANNRSFWPYMLLREYFVYPEKFMFINLSGFDQLTLTDQLVESFEYEITFKKQLPVDKPFITDNFRLFCSPVINLFLTEIEPVNFTNQQSEYFLKADSTLEAIHIHSVENVTGVGKTSGKRSEYENLYSFKYIDKSKSKTFATRYARNPSGHRDMYLIVDGNTLDEKGVFEEENLSIKAWCSNASIPRDYIREGMINRPGKEFPDYIKVSNITRPTMPFPPPDDKSFLWIFQSHLSATWASLSSPDTLKCFLRIHDWSRQEARARRIDAISAIESQPIDQIVQGNCIRGVVMTISIHEAEFKDSGDIYLFGLVLHRFLSQFISINSFLNLVFVLKPSDQKIVWNALEGKRCLI